MVDGGKPGVGSREEGSLLEGTKHVRRNIYNLI